MATTFPVEQVPPPTSFKIQTSSPLDTLVRRTSAKRVRAAIQSTASQQYPLGHLIDDYAASPSQDEDAVDPYSGYTDLRHVPLNLPRQSQQNPPNSPLLHSHFARYSTATSSMNGSYLDSRSSVDSRNVNGTVRPYDPTIPPSTPAAPSASTQRTPVPTVVVSSPDAENTLSRPGRAPVVRPITSNFSRPPSTSGNSGTGLSPVTLPRQPPPRTGSPASLYSTYSYYNFENAAPSPVNSNFSGPSPQTSPAHSPSPWPNGTKRLQPIYPEDNKQRSRSPNKTRMPSLTAPPEPQTPQDYLQLGIQSHEANRLNEAAMYFEKSAKENGGCGVGMLMWGLTLRHGWGCEKNEKVGFKWLRNAAESAVVDLESARGGKSVDTSSVQDELVLAIYEVGQCFFHGWGVHKDQKLAVSYYTVAARLGDPDAQNDLAFCLANGKGCKKDRKEAAKWYRAAVAQGVSDVGLAWIYKDKFM
ncbi:Protein DSF2 [Leucoagaricus sp. SymC.cos]|nr:Protein DSF2 [Leucoagaricus sp. SymC.cos]